MLAMVRQSVLCLTVSLVWLEVLLQGVLPAPLAIAQVQFDNSVGRYWLAD